MRAYRWIEGGLWCALVGAVYLVAAALLDVGAPRAQAQQGNTTGIVVTSCANATPAFRTGVPGPLRIDQYGNLCTEDAGYAFANIAAIGTNTVKSAAGVLHTFCINTAANNGTITVYDNTTATGTKIATITSYTATPFCSQYDVAFATGLTIVTATATPDFTVSYR